MNKLVQVIEATRAKIDALRKHGLKETPTRTIVIDPLVEPLGCEVPNPRASFTSLQTPFSRLYSQHTRGPSGRLSHDESTS